jgi:photosystem II stability/assembly factor-like uncharacterized protein
MHRLYVGTIGEGLWRSVDGGETFQRTCDGMFVECHVRALVSHPRQPQVLFLGSEQGLFRSTDGADSWSRVDSPLLNGQQVWSILLSPHDPQLLLVGTCPSRLFRSEDGGKTWREPAVKMVQECPRILWTRVTTLKADPIDTGTVWAGVEIDGLRRSHDGGLSWEAVGVGLSSQDIHDLAFLTRNGRRRMLAATNNDLNLSEDEGLTWQPLHIDQSLPWKYCRALAMPCGDTEQILLGHGDGPPGDAGLVGRSSDGGASWRATEMPGRANSTIWNFAVHEADANLIYASSVSGEVYRSTDRGVSWEKLRREFGEIRALAWTV